MSSGPPRSQGGEAYGLYFMAEDAGSFVSTPASLQPLRFLLYLWLLIRAVPVSPNEKEAHLCYFRPKMEGMMS